jgi:hypothetical protein
MESIRQDDPSQPRSRRPQLWAPRLEAPAGLRTKGLPLTARVKAATFRDEATVFPGWAIQGVTRLSVTRVKKAAPGRERPEAELVALLAPGELSSSNGSSELDRSSRPERDVEVNRRDLCTHLARLLSREE